jgi:hypothetical protein
MQVWQRGLGGIAFLVSFLFVAGVAQAAQFSATMVTKVGGVDIPGKIYVKDGNMRNDIQAAGQNMTHIMRSDKNVVWVIMPQQKIYMEAPVSTEARQKMMPLTEEQRAKMKKVGSETINGYACDKYQATMTLQGKSMQVFTWVATDLNMPIKIVSQDGSFAMEYKDIKPGEVAASLFELPQGYQKVKLPMGMPPAK